MMPSYNPYQDKSLHLTIRSGPPLSPEERTPFNDVIRHADIVSGFRHPKLGSQLPSWLQSPYRVVAAVSVLLFAGGLVYGLIQNLADAAGK
ncbi:hypothetical protein MJA45_24480 [Paenibacillus aurantius]|uniref:Uncharacterized protein n=1 Tax=Paenibacillus aurantius TaxID=2918900 RepID=A0AA96LFT8_9BACL|nr:hypothetical protein [Paenibacillus aurantius]WNQ10742.1 hypothetical protein MJA45_24480 [Paenibacillus aurantius]